MNTHSKIWLFLFLVPLLGAGDYRFYESNELESITEELNIWCSSQKDSDLLISFLLYGHPWPPSAIRISLTEREIADGETLSPPAHTKGRIEWIRFSWNDKTKNWIQNEDSFDLSTKDILQIEETIDRSELFTLAKAEKDYVINGSHKLIFRSYALDPMTVAARAINKGGEIEVTRETSSSISMDFVIEEINKLMDEKLVQQSVQATSASARPRQRVVD